VYAPLNFGNALADKGQLDEAIKVYREWFRVIEYFNLEIAFYDKNQINESIMACKKAVRINPEDVIAHNALGNALADKGQLDEAIAEYKEAIRIDPEYADTYYYLGYTFKAKSHFDEAINAFENFIRFFQDSEIKNAKYIAEEVRKLITQLKGAR
jgi:tetratricopeptide (TPR) repeat protein